MERPSPYRGDEPYVFVCYSHTDMDDVLAEVAWLQESGVNVWFDEGITPGTEWREELGDAIRSCGLFLYFVTPAAIASPNCRRELNFALEQDRPILAVHLIETDLTDGMRLSLNDRQAILRYGESGSRYREKLAASVGQALATPIQPASGSHSRRKPRLWQRSVLVVLFAAIVAAFTVWLLRLEPPEIRPQVVAFEIRLDEPLQAFLVRVVAVSPDGRRVAYSRTSNTSRGSLHIRSLDSLEERVLSGGGNPHFSPDGRWVALGGQEKVPVLGGAPQPISEAPEAGRTFGGTWVDGETVLFADSFGLHTVAATGGEPELLASPDEAADEISYAWPAMLPGGRWALFTVVGKEDTAVHALDLATGHRRVLLEGGTSARYARTGHLVFARSQELHAVPFDAETLGVQGEPVNLGIGVMHTRLTGANFDLSDNGTLVFLPVPERAPPSLVWVDRDGLEEEIGASDHGWVYPRVSPDGRFIASDATGGTLRDVYVWDVRLGSLLPLTSNPTEDMIPVWSHDGRRVFFASDRDGTFDIFSRSADGASEATLVFASEHFEVPSSLTPSGDGLLIAQNRGEDMDILLLDLTRSDAPVRDVLATEYSESNAELSPDGRWLAYHSDASGQMEVYVRPFPEIERRRWRVSKDGGRFPYWSKASNEIFYVDANGDMVAVAWSAAPDFAVMGSTRLFSGEHYVTDTGARPYDVSLQDGRFLMKKRPRNVSGPDTIVVIVNWFEELKKRVPRS